MDEGLILKVTISRTQGDYYEQRKKNAERAIETTKEIISELNQNLLNARQNDDTESESEAMRLLNYYDGKLKIP